MIGSAVVVVVGDLGEGVSGEHFGVDGNRRSGVLGTQVESNTRAAEITVVVTWL